MTFDERRIMLDAINDPNKSLIFCSCDENERGFLKLRGNPSLQLAMFASAFDTWSENMSMFQVLRVLFRMWLAIRDRRKYYLSEEQAERELEKVKNRSDNLWSGR